MRVSFTYRFGGSDGDKKQATKVNTNTGGKRKSQQQNNQDKDKERQNLKTDESGGDQGGQ